MAFQEDLKCLYTCKCVNKNSFVFVFHSLVSDVSNGPGAVWDPLRATFTVASVFFEDVLRTRWGAIGDVFPHPTRSFYFSAHLDYLDYFWWHFRSPIINNCYARIEPTK